MVPNITNTLGNVSNSFSQNESSRRTPSLYEELIFQSFQDPAPSLAERNINHSLNRSDYISQLALAILELEIESRTDPAPSEHSEDSVSSASERSEVYEDNRLSNNPDWPDEDTDSAFSRSSHSDIDFDIERSPNFTHYEYSEPTCPLLTECPNREILPEGAACTMMSTEIPAEYGILINNNPFDIRYLLKGMLTQDELIDPYTKIPFSNENLNKICGYIGCSQTQLPNVWGWSFFDSRRNELCILLDRSVFNGKNTQKFVDGFKQILFEGS